MISPWYVKGIHLPDHKVAEKVSNSFDQRLDHPVSPPYSAIAPPSFPCRPGSSVLIDGHFRGPLIEKQAHHETWKEFTKGCQSTFIFCMIPCTDCRPCDVLARVTIDMLPDVALLEIFNVYIYEEADGYEDEGIESWQTLVHVCRKWRNVVFGSPRRLNLRLYCSASTPVRQTLDVWPPLPIVIKVFSKETWDGGNIVAALEHNDRICHLVIFDIPSSETGTALAALQRPFPALTYLQLAFRNEAAPVLPASFLGGSAPALQTLCLDRIPFLGLPKLLLSATHLVNLYILRIPDSGYISPEAMVAALSVLTRLESLQIGFESPRSRPNWRTRRPPLRIPTLLPVLTRLMFKGVAEYLEDLVARIDAPLLDDLRITFFHQLIFESPQLTRFISRTPTFKAYNEARVEFSDLDVTVTFPQTFDRRLKLGISCEQSDWQLSSVAQVCSSSFPPALIPTVEHLYIRSGFQRPDWQDDIESSQWLEFFHPFTAMKDLYISSEFAPHIASSLEELVGDGVIEVLPALQTLFLGEPLPSGPVQEAIVRFVVARELSGHPIAVSRWTQSR